MKAYLLYFLFLGALILACSKSGKEISKDGEEPPESNIKNCFCADTLKCGDLCPKIPVEINEKFFAGYTAKLDSHFQPPFDIFSWQAFVALNWPADGQGKPAGNIADSSSAQRVWEYYTDPDEIFASTDKTLLMTDMEKARREGKKFFYMTSKSEDELDSLRGFREADGHPLIDRNLNFAVYEIKVNPAEKDFIVKNNLITKAAIDSFARKHDNNKHLKDSLYLDLPGGVVPDIPGSMEIKASWRILDTAKGDIPSRYYTREAVIFISGENSLSGKPFTINAKVGLVGMHIITKTPRFGQLIWSTFEHVDNTPVSTQEAQAHRYPEIPWSFYNPECLTCEPNNPAAHLPGDTINGHVYYRWDTAAPYAKRYATSVPGELDGKLFGTQAVRLYPVYYWTELINRIWQEKLKGSIWANYKLIGSQWTAADAGLTGPNVPGRLANTTLETFIQQDASCISCHNGASVVHGKDTIYTDLSFIFGRAK